ncbi:unnamed protein product [Paramecium primaurelia]|uniref:Uncharacterized protein n=1 Tax=Paramecium primaurelia TaxID=5886 RepID=A0A8S1LRN1_PARPR|nr:unnamed protein product [Paramecium primaurelia]
MCNKPQEKKSVYYHGKDKNRSGRIISTNEPPLLQNQVSQKFSQFSNEYERRDCCINLLCRIANLVIQLIWKNLQFLQLNNNTLCYLDNKFTFNFQKTCSYIQAIIVVCKLSDEAKLTVQVLNQTLQSAQVNNVFSIKHVFIQHLKALCYATSFKCRAYSINKTKS